MGHPSSADLEVGDEKDLHRPTANVVPAASGSEDHKHDAVFGDLDGKGPNFRGVCLSQTFSRSGSLANVRVARCLGYAHCYDQDDDWSRGAVGPVLFHGYWYGTGRDRFLHHGSLLHL